MEGCIRVTTEYAAYLRDESRSSGNAESISFPRTEEEVIATVKLMRSNRVPVTIQGARTGLAASAVPEGGHVMSLGHMNEIISAAYDVSKDSFTLTVQPGVLLSEVRKALAGKSFDVSGWDEESKEALSHMKSGEWFYPTDPTETSASIGGMVACNASGAKSFRYGSARDHVAGLRVVLSDGDVIDIKRGQHKASGRHFDIVTEGGRHIAGDLPDYDMPFVKKNTAGYYNRPDMDMLDLFIGAEGTLGVATAVTISLSRTEAVRWGVMAFLPDEKTAIKFVRAVRGELKLSDTDKLTVNPSAIEFFSHKALELLRSQQRTNPAFAQIQELKDKYHTGIFVELESSQKGEVWQSVKAIGSIMEALGGSEDDTWVSVNETEMEKFKYFRHACPECVNMLIDEVRKTEPQVTKLGTDMSVPDDRLDDVMDMYNEGIRNTGLNAVIFGHIGNNHLHVNIIPENMDEYRRGKALYEVWAEAVARMGGSVSAEHGVGKLKAAFLRHMYDDEVLDSMRRLKIVFDDCQLFNRGNIFPYRESGGLS